MKSLQYGTEEFARDLARQQPGPVLGEHNRMPYGFVEGEPCELIKQWVAVHLFHQYPFAANAVEHPQRQGSRAAFRWDGLAAVLFVEIVEDPVE